MLLMLFGLPGAGKSFAGEILRADFGFTFHEADDDIPADYRQRVVAGQVVDEDRRDAYHRHLLDRLAELQLTHPRLAVAAPLLRDRHRQWIRQRFSQAAFILVEVDFASWEARLSARTHTISLAYARQVAGLNEPVTVEHYRVDNSAGGADGLRLQLAAIVREIEAGSQSSQRDRF